MRRKGRERKTDCSLVNAWFSSDLILAAWAFASSLGGSKLSALSDGDDGMEDAGVDGSGDGGTEEELLLLSLIVHFKSTVPPSVRLE